MAELINLILLEQHTGAERVWFENLDDSGIRIHAVFPEEKKLVSVDVPVLTIVAIRDVQGRVDLCVRRLREKMEVG